jgi:hypothetical protein
LQGAEVKLIHISTGGPNRVILDATGKRWMFEMHPFCGPAALDARGEIASKQPGPRSPFWHAVTRWAQGGHRLNSNECIWEDEPQPILEHIAGKHYRVTGWR